MEALSGFLGLGLLALAGPAGQPADEARCAALAQAPIVNGRITSARPVTPEDGFETGLAFPSKLPLPRRLCRVAMTLSPVTGSTIRAELWLPMDSGWNGKLLAAGNGGFGGSLSDPMLTMRAAVARGYAAVGNDMGHDAADPTWFARDTAVTDFAWRADHASTAAAKTILATYYGAAARLTYFHGCSSGGREALAAATRFPADYDGVIAGAPPADYSGLLLAAAWTQQQLARPGAMLDEADLQLLGKARLAACDAKDGQSDGIIGDPRRCRFEPRALACRPGQSSGCLTPVKLKAARAIYRGPPGLAGTPTGAEATPDGWAAWIVGPNARHRYFLQGAIGGMMLRDPARRIADFDLVRDAPKVRATFRANGVDAPPADLSAFRRRGGRLILYHGWADAGVNPLGSIRWRDAVAQRMGRRAADETLALFMVPGLGHCAGGVGPHHLDMLGALELWREAGQAPSQVLGTRFSGSPLAAAMELPAGRKISARPVCRYPAVARWDGRGDPDQAEHYRCRR